MNSLVDMATTPLMTFSLGVNPTKSAMRRSCDIEHRDMVCGRESEKRILNGATRQEICFIKAKIYADVTRTTKKEREETERCSHGGYTAVVIVVVAVIVVCCSTGSSK